MEGATKSSSWGVIQPTSNDIEESHRESESRKRWCKWENFSYTRTGGASQPLWKFLEEKKNTDTMQVNKKIIHVSNEGADQNQNQDRLMNWASGGNSNNDKLRQYFIFTLLVWGDRIKEIREMLGRTPEATQATTSKIENSMHIQIGDLGSLARRRIALLGSLQMQQSCKAILW